MAEAMIAGILRGNLVTPEHVVASHPRVERREELAAAYGIRTVASNAEAVEAADIVLLAIKPQMLAMVGREIRPLLRDDQLVLSVIAGATTTALEGFLGHRRLVRSMPNTPARLGRGMTVWYATPETTAEQRAQASALLRALGAELQVDDEKFVAMATAVSGTGPTYVFLVMEALIDAAVHLGFPRHIAHDLVVETLEGSTYFAKQSGDHRQDKLLIAQQRPDLAPDLGQHLRLDGEQDDVGPVDGLGVARHGPDAIGAGEFVAALRSRVAGHHLLGRDQLAAQDAGDHRLGHDAGANGGDRALGEWCHAASIRVHAGPSRTVAHQGGGPSGRGMARQEEPRRRADLGRRKTRALQ